MIKFLKNIALFLFIAIIIGEIFVRITHATADIPQRTIDDNGIQKYYPNQTGYWLGGDHKWTITSLGWPGELPNSYSNLISIIGDSFIENFMNPNECHQSAFLKKEMPTFNFIEAGRSGVTLIESLEISKQTDSLNPKITLIHTGTNDVYESIREIKIKSDITQLNTEKRIIINGKMKSPYLKKILYSCKLLYYFYNRFPLSFGKSSNKDIKKNKITRSKFELNETKLKTLISYIKENYNIENKIFVFKPNSDKNIVALFKSMNLNLIILNSSKDKTWCFDHDSHWTCYGHERAANQIKKRLQHDFLYLIN